MCRTRALEQAQRSDEHQAKTRSNNIQDNIVDVDRSIAPCSRKVLNDFDADRKGNRDSYHPPEAKTPPDQREQDAEREKEHHVALCVMQAKRSRGRAIGQERRRTGQRSQIGTEVDSHRSLGSQTRIVVGDESSDGKPGEIDDKGQEQDFARE